MSRFKLGVVGVLAAFVLLVVGGVGASTASAAFTLTTKLCSGGTTINLCYETSGSTSLWELEGEEEFELLAAEANFRSKLGEEKIEVLCTSVDAEHLNAKGEFAPDGLVKQLKPLVENYKVEDTVLFFLGCTLTAGPTKKCKVAVEQRTKHIKGVPLTEELIDFTSEEEKIFIEIPFENNGTEVCPVTIRGNQKVTGEQEANWLTILKDEEEHTLDTVVKSGLKFGASETAAELSLEVPVFLLALLDPWAIEETA